VRKHLIRAASNNVKDAQVILEITTLIVGGASTSLKKIRDM